VPEAAVTTPVVMMAPVASTPVVPAEMSPEVRSAAEVMSAKAAMSEMMPATVAAHVEAVMASAMVSAVRSRVRCQRHCECRHQRQHENKTALHFGSFIS
jgi:macrodomain Ter protein organizer (MatP/YcbG family)